MLDAQDVRVQMYRKVPLDIMASILFSNGMDTINKMGILPSCGGENKYIIDTFSIGVNRMLYNDTWKLESLKTYNMVPGV